MKTTSPPLSPDQTVADLAHLAWCALVAMRTAQQDGQALSPLAEHVFLLRWLAVAQKQRRFPRSVAMDTDSLLRLGRQKGPGARLHERLEYLWQSCSGELSQQSDLFRLTYAIETLKSQGWINEAVAEDEWDPEILAGEYVAGPALLVRKQALFSGFSDQGDLQAPVDFLVTGDMAEAVSVLADHGLRGETRGQGSGVILTLVPRLPVGEGSPSCG